MSDDGGGYCGQQISPGEWGAGMVKITDASNNLLGYCLSVDGPLTSPDGSPWPPGWAPGSTAQDTGAEWWFFSASALTDIQNGTITGLKFTSTAIQPADPVTPATASSDPLTVLPAQLTSPVANLCKENVTFLSASNGPISTGGLRKMFGDSDGSVAIGLVFETVGTSYGLKTLLWCTTETDSKAKFWFGTNGNQTSTAIVVNSGLPAVGQYPSEDIPFSRKWVACQAWTIGS